MAHNFARFPLPFKVGTDICLISRVKQILNGPRPGRLIKRILTEKERAIASDLLDPFMAERPVQETANTDDKPETRPISSKAPRFLASRYVSVLTERLRTIISRPTQVRGEGGCHQSKRSYAYFSRHSHLEETEWRAICNHQGRQREKPGSGSSAQHQP